MLRSFSFVAAAALLLAGCVIQSIQPLFAEKDLIPVPIAGGSWEQRDGGKRIGLWTFSGDGKRFTLAHTDEKGSKATFDVTAGKIGTNVFLDFALHDIEPHGSLNDFATVTLIAAHTFVRLEKRNEALLLSAMDYEWLEKHLKANSKAVSHVWQDKRPILTSPPEELQKFIAKHANDEAIFKNKIQLTPVQEDK